MQVISLNTNSKKYGEVKYDIALDYSGNYVHISEVRKGKKYYCPECKSEFIPRRGKIRKHHFAHKGGVPPSCTGESGLHALMKHKMAYLLIKSKREEKKVNALYKCEFCGKYHKLKIEYTNVKIEEDLGDIRPDIYLGKWALEIFHRHSVDEEKIQKCHKRGIGVVEVHVEDLEKFFNQEENYSGNLTFVPSIQDAVDEKLPTTKEKQIPACKIIPPDQSECPALKEIKEGRAVWLEDIIEKIVSSIVANNKKTYRFSLKDWYKWQTFEFDGKKVIIEWEDDTYDQYHTNNIREKVLACNNKIIHLYAIKNKGILRLFKNRKQVIIAKKLGGYIWSRAIPPSKKYPKFKEKTPFEIAEYVTEKIDELENTYSETLKEIKEFKSRILELTKHALIYSKTHGQTFKIRKEEDGQYIMINGRVKIPQQLRFLYHAIIDENSQDMIDWIYPCKECKLYPCEKCKYKLVKYRFEYTNGQLSNQGLGPFPVCFYVGNRWACLIVYKSDRLEQHIENNWLKPRLLKLKNPNEEIKVFENLIKRVYWVPKRTKRRNYHYY